MIPPLSLQASSGVNGDSKSGVAADFYFSSPFAVGSGASAESAQSPGTAGRNSQILWLGLAALGVAALARFSR